MTKEKIPFNKPFIIGGELFNIARAVIEYSDLSGDGVYTRTCQEWFQEKLCCDKALLTHSCTGALEMAAILCDIKPGDEVIMPSYTFVSTANAFVLRGGVPVFVDIRPDTLNIDEKKIEAAITSRTKAVVPVHYAGVSCAMDEIMQIAERYNLWVIEDAAQALLSKYKNKYLGTIGHFGTLSFHETKNIISGEGGALLINDKRFIERAEIIWEKGTNRKSFFRGEIDKYTWVDIGSSFLPSEMIAAFLAEQLKYAETIIGARRRIFELYNHLLQVLEEQEKIRLPRIGPEDDSNGHIFYVITRSEAERTGLIDYLRNENIHPVFHYIPLHSSPAGEKYGKMGAKELPNTDDLSMRVVRLPLFYEMSEEQVHRVVEAIIAFYSSVCLY
jgi:dTDP-4-amino-4,6-dideoxygalactose transaminase